LPSRGLWRNNDSMWYLHKGTFAAKASTTEEPDAGKLHVRVCAGVSGNGRSYREMPKKEVHR
jgi:hypothetical protein